MALLSKQQALRKVPPRHYDKHFEELGGEIRFVEMMQPEWEAFDKQGSAYAVRLFIAAARGADGKRLFDDGDINKVVALYPMHIIEAGAQIVLELNGILVASKQGILKNSETGPTAPATGESPDTSDT